MLYVCLFVQSSRPRYIQRSKSHDDPHADIHAPAGTARGRIARQGARMVRSRSPSSSPSGTPKPQTGPTSPPLKKGYSTDSPAEVPVTYMAGSSPPQSAQSLKEEKTFFRYSFKKKSPTPQSSKDKSDSTDSVQSPISPMPQYPTSSPVGPLSPSAKNPISPLPEGPLSPSVPEPVKQSKVAPQSRFMTLASTPKTNRSAYSSSNPFVSLAHDKYDKPKPLVTSPDKKAPKSLVQSRIQMFTLPERKSGPSERKSDKAASLSPPPIPPRQHEIAKSQGEQESSSSSTSGTKFMSRNRQRPFSPPQKQRAINKLLHELPVSESSAFHVPYPKFSPQGAQADQSSTNPFLSQQCMAPDQGRSGQEKEGIKQTYVSRCSSDESLTEYTSLLKEEDKSSSRSSVCIYFDGKDIPDTLV